jgi:oligoribonuclease
MITPSPAYLFLDLETTGFDPYTGSVLEIACIITSEHLTELASYTSLVAPGPAVWSDEATLMHLASGLVYETQSARPLDAVAADLDAWLTAALGGTTPHLAGNSVHFDRAWLSLHAPRILRHCTHRHLDVTSLLLATAPHPRLAAKVHAQDPSTHRALPDCRRSLATARRFAQAMMEM